MSILQWKHTEILIEMSDIHQDIAEGPLKGI